MPVSGATGAVLRRGLASMAALVALAIDEVRSGDNGLRETFSVASFIGDAMSAAQLEASAAGCALAVQAVDATIAVRGNRDLLLGALANLLQNAFKFTRPGTEVTLRAHSLGGEVPIEVADHCGGLPPGSATKMFTPFAKRSSDKSGLGLGHFPSLARASRRRRGR